MKTSIKNKSKTEIEITVELSKESFDRYYKNALDELRKKVKVKGFRPGKVPQEVAEKQIGQDKILNHAAQQAIKEKYVEIIKEKDLEVIERPKVEILKLAPNNPLEFKVEATILPKIELPDYKEIAGKVKEKPEPAKEDDIKKTLEWIQKSRSKLKPLDRAAKKGDFVHIEYFSPEVEGGERKKDAFILGEGKLVPGFEEKIEGMKKGEEKDFSLKVPKDFSSKEISGKEVKFNVKLEEVSEIEEPELNDDFAKSLGDFKNLKKLKENIKEGIEKEKEKKSKDKAREKIVDKINQAIEWNLPDSLIAAEKERLFEDFKQSFSKNPNASFEDYLKNAKKSEEKIKDSFQEPAERNVKTYIVLKEIAKKEGIDASEEEAEEEVNKLLAANPTIKKESLDLERVKYYTRERLINEKVFQLLEKQSKKS
jgi:trigger factor